MILNSSLYKIPLWDSIAWDKDDILFDTAPAVLSYTWWIISWVKLKLEDIFSYNFTDLHPNITLKDAIAAFEWTFSSDYKKLELPLIPWAVETIIYAKGDLWRKNKIVTSDSEHRKNYLYDLLDKYFYWLFNDVFFCNWYAENKVPKSFICKIEWMTDLIDDDHGKSVEVSDNWINACLRNTPWSISRPEHGIIRSDVWHRIQRVDNQEQIREYLRLRSLV